MPCVHDEDLVGCQDRAQPVRDDNAGAPAHRPVERLLDQRFGLRVQVGGRLVQDQDARVFQQHPRDGEPLLLAA